MSTNLSPAELAALRGKSGASAGPEVSPWDLARVRRLSGDDVTEATRLIERALPAIESRLREVAGLAIQVQLFACHEVGADGLLDGIEDPLAMVAFQVGGQPGWCIWDTPMAIATIEGVLVGLPRAVEPIADEDADSAKPAEAQSAATEAHVGDAAEAETAPPSPPPFDPELHRRQPTAMERRVLVRLLSTPIERIAEVLGIAVVEPGAIELRKHVPNWRDTTGARPDPHRLAIDLAITTEIGQSTISIYLPMSGMRGMLGSVDAGRAKAASSKVPEHLDSVPVEIDVVLGGAELSLADLMSLEVGDVIPIEAAVGDAVRLFANGIEFARGRPGTHRGHLAVTLSGDIQPLSKKP